MCARVPVWVGERKRALERERKRAQTRSDAGDENYLKIVHVKHECIVDEMEDSCHTYTHTHIYTHTAIFSVTVRIEHKHEVQRFGV